MSWSSPYASPGLSSRRNFHGIPSTLFLSAGLFHVKHPANLPCPVRDFLWRVFFTAALCYNKYGQQPAVSRTGYADNIGMRSDRNPSRTLYDAAQKGGVAVENKKFYQKAWFLCLCIVICPLIGLVLVWTIHREKKLSTKIYLSVVIAFLFYVWLNAWLKGPQPLAQDVGGASAAQVIFCSDNF